MVVAVLTVPFPSPHNVNQLSFPVRSDGTRVPKDNQDMMLQVQAAFPSLNHTILSDIAKREKGFVIFRLPTGGEISVIQSYSCPMDCNSPWPRYRVASTNRLRACHNNILTRLLELPRWISSSLASYRNGMKCLDDLRRHFLLSMKSNVKHLKTSSPPACESTYAARMAGSYVGEHCALLFRGFIPLVKLYLKE